VKEVGMTADGVGRQYHKEQLRVLVREDNRIGRQEEKKRGKEI